MERQLKLPVGIENFEKIRRDGFYYVDKTLLIEQLLEQWGEVNLFTRPRRFGKSMNMSMLKSFFEIGSDSQLFEGLKISEETALCKEYQGQFPVISITLKNVEGISFEAAKASMKDTIGTEARRFTYLLASDKLTKEDKESFQALISAQKDGSFQMSDIALEKSLYRLTELLDKHFGRSVILLIDEYDVPLDKAFQAGYYDSMVLLLRSILGNVLKTNAHLKFSVMTGCLRIAKESIFTGLNNFKVYSIANAAFDEYFGFTEEEVSSMLQYYRLEDDAETVKEWYDGYRFGKADVYCPWDVINYCSDHRLEPDLEPQNYWMNTSSNQIVRRFIDKANLQTRTEIEALISGKSILKEIYLELTYNELDRSIENLWSVLFTTGYLTQQSKEKDGYYRLKIPNREIQTLFIRQIREWFKESTQRDAETLNTFCEAFPAGKPEKIEALFNQYLWNTISIRDTASAKKRKENFYHGLLLGLLRYKEHWLVQSNAESGEGYSDILIEIPEFQTGIVIEIKYAEECLLEQACQKALRQIEDRKYAAKLYQDGMKNVLKYGISCYKKQCKVMMK